MRFFSALISTFEQTASIGIDGLPIIKKMMTVVPPMKQLKKSFNYCKKEHVTYKLLIDLYGSSLKITEAPSYDKYTKQVVPFAI